MKSYSEKLQSIKTMLQESIDENISKSINDVLTRMFKGKIKVEQAVDHVSNLLKTVTKQDYQENFDKLYAMQLGDNSYQASLRRKKYQELLFERMKNFQFYEEPSFEEEVSKSTKIIKKWAYGFLGLGVVLGLLLYPSMAMMLRDLIDHDFEGSKLIRVIGILTSSIVITVPLALGGILLYVYDKVDTITEGWLSTLLDLMIDNRKRLRLDLKK